MKNRFIISFLFFVLFSMVSFAQKAEYQLSSHILDINRGAPAEGVAISLSRMSEDNVWTVIDEKVTDENGRVKDFLEGTGNAGIYKLTYHVGDYFDALGQDSFYPFVEVVFEIKDDSHYHVPITLSPYGYSTYRGN